VRKKKRTVAGGKVCIKGGVRSIIGGGELILKEKGDRRTNINISGLWSCRKKGSPPREKKGELAFGEQGERKHGCRIFSGVGKGNMGPHAYPTASGKKSPVT